MMLGKTSQTSQRSKYYDKELEDLAEQINQVKDQIPEIPEVRYYEAEIEAICEQIDLVKEVIDQKLQIYQR